MKRIKILIIITIILTLTSCYDNKELNKIAIVTMTEINKKDDYFTIKVAIANSKKQSDKKYTIYEGKGKTIQDAYRQIKLTSSKYIYPEHLELLIIDEDLAKKNINEILDFYLRNPIVRTEFYVIIGKKENILNNKSNINIKGILKSNNKYQGISNIVTFNDFTNMKLNPNTEIILPSITIDDNKQYKLSGLGIFKSNRLLGYLTNDESIAYNIIKNNTTNTIINYQCKNNKYLSIEITQSKSKIKVKNNSINIDLNISANINESNCDIDLSNEYELNELKYKLEQYLNKKLKENIDKIKNEYNSDVFGFLDEIYKHDYNNYLKLKNNWYSEAFKTIPINIKTKIDIVGKGNIMENINEKN